MGNYKVRIKKKGKRWLKGQSSNSNPESRKYRDLAKTGYFREDDAEGTHVLTTESLRKHDNIVGCISVSDYGTEHSEIDDAEVASLDSGTYKTFGSFASDWSACSNVSFNRLLTRFNTTSAHHKEMLAVLAAVTEVIKASGGTENNTEYFAALITTLEGMKNEEGKDESVAAVLSLLSMCIKNVPRSVLQLKFSTASKILMEFLKNYADSNNNVILRSIIGCLSVLLRAQEAAVWHDNSTVAVYDAVLSFVVHTKPKIRKCAQHAICAILKASAVMNDDENIKIHPVAKHTGKYCIEILEQCTADGSVTAVLHMFLLLKEILGIFPEPQLKACCECILKLMTLKNVLLTSCGFQALYGMLISKPPVSSCTPELNSNLIMALYDYQPRTTDSQPMLAWLAVMQEAFSNLSRHDAARCIPGIRKFVEVYSDILLTSKQEVANNATWTMNVILNDCITQLATPQRVREYGGFIKEIFSAIKSCAESQYNASLRHILHVLAIFFKVCGATCDSFMLPYLKSLAELRDTEEYPYKGELEQVFSSAIQTVGPQKIIQEIPIQVVALNGKYEFRRSWLLPLLRSNIRNSTLQCFKDYFLPIATVCWNNCITCKTSNDKPGEVSYDLLQSQIWALLPSFCETATDIPDTFPKMAKPLGMTLTSREDLRLTLLSALRRLIKRSQDIEDNEGTMQKYAKNFLPILFNIYTSPIKEQSEESVKSATFETIKAYLDISSPTLQSNMYERALGKLENEENADIKELLLDLVKLLLPYQQPDAISIVYEKYILKVMTEDCLYKEQKKYFKFLETLMSSKTDSCEQFVYANLNSIKELLMKSLTKKGKNNPDPRKGKMRCCFYYIDYDSSKETMFQLVHEAVLSIKHVNTKCREAALRLITKVVDTVSTQSENLLREFFDYILSGLVRDSAHISRTISVLTFLVHHCKGRILLEQFDVIVTTMCTLCTSPNREITGPAISFMKLLVTSFTSDTERHLTLIVRRLSEITDDCKRKYRQKLHHVYDRLIRKFGPDMIIKLTPSSDEKTHLKLRAMRKIYNRKLKMKARLQLEGSKNGSSDNGSESLFSVKSKAKSIEEILAECDLSDNDESGSVTMKSVRSDKSQKGSKRNQKKSGSDVYIHEVPESVVDFTDTKSVRNISTSGSADTDTSSVKVIVKKGVEFPTAPDGRLIITKSKKSLSASKSYLSDDADSDTNEGFTLKRRRHDDISDDEEIGVVEDTHSIYKAGGSGIHRPIKKKKMSSVNKQPGSEYRSHKAKGDMKRRGLPDPYAYVPLKRNMLNKRKKKKAASEFKNIVKGAKQGATKGIRKKGQKNKFKLVMRSK